MAYVTPAFLRAAFKERAFARVSLLAFSINDARASSVSLKLALNIRMLLYFSDHLVREKRGIFTPKLASLLVLSRKKRIVSLMMSLVLLTIGTLLGSLMTKFKQCAAQCTNIARGTFRECVFELHSHDLR